MTIEEKAKAYDEAKTRMSIAYNSNRCTIGFMNEIFPELKESEEEKIKKRILLSLQKDIMTTKNSGCNTKDLEKCIAWLEKQGEVESDNDDIEVEEKGIREAFNKIEDEKQGKQKSQRMISAEAKEAMYKKPADTVEPKCDESETKIFDAPTPFEDKLYAFVAACEFLAIPSKIEFILEHSQEILDAAKEQIGKEQSSAWSEDDEKMLVDAYVMLDWYKGNNWWTARRIKDWLETLKQRIGG